MVIHWVQVVLYIFKLHPIHCIAGKYSDFVFVVSMLLSDMISQNAHDNIMHGRMHPS